MDFALRFLYPGLGLGLTLLFGFWLARLGRPYHGWLFNLHKLIALGVVIGTTLQVQGLLRGTTVAQPIMVTVVAAALGVIALFASGAFLSIGNVDYRALKITHAMGLGLAVLGMAGLLVVYASRLP